MGPTTVREYFPILHKPKDLLYDSNPKGKKKETGKTGFDKVHCATTIGLLQI